MQEITIYLSKIKVFNSNSELNKRILKSNKLHKILEAKKLDYFNDLNNNVILISKKGKVIDKIQCKTGMSLTQTFIDKYTNLFGIKWKIENSKKIIEWEK